MKNKSKTSVGHVSRDYQHQVQCVISFNNFNHPADEITSYRVPR